MKFANTVFISFVTWIIALPAYAADVYKIDPAHTSITFSVRHLGINNVKGRFKDFAGTVALDGKTIKEANGTIQVASIDTEVQQRDDHLRSPDFFDAMKHPTITFKTKRVEQSGDQSVLIADFTMRGVTKEIRLPVRITGPVKDQTGAVRIGVSTKTKLDRKDYGIAFSQALESGVAMVGEEVEIEIDAEAVKEAKS
jgi:polyisoprenoid-binding protein YceI